jgi:glycosyltransferase involved in cell wall biosynthesis
MNYADIAALKHLKKRRSSSSLVPFRGGQGTYPIIVHSHLRWDWVWQRPQQFLSRLSKKHRILFVEAPIPSQEAREPRAMLREVTDYPNIVVLQMQMPVARWNNSQWVDKERRRLVQSVLDGPVGAAFNAPVQWFYDPMAVTAFAGHMEEQAIVYDCMDELSLFRGAPAELVRRERELLALADVVFAGGPKMWRAKRRLNPNCFLFGCGVDAKHFGQALFSRCPIPSDIVQLPRPIYGYIGVVDERIDYELIAALSAANSGSIVMVGPSTKVDPATFPQRNNLHWMGGRDYADLPGYAKGFDVCLMPFALNEATRFINPTKTLEYLAAGRPVVSTPIEDVVSQFRNVVGIGASPREFIAKCLQASNRPDRRAIERGLAMVRRNSWESIVQQIEKHIDDVLASKRSLETHAA